MCTAQCGSMEAKTLSFVLRAAGSEHHMSSTRRVFTYVVGGRVGMNDTCYFDMKKLDLPTFLPSIPAYLPPSLPACLPACLPTYPNLPTYLQPTTPTHPPHPPTCLRRVALTFYNYGRDSQCVFFSLQESGQIIK